MFKRLLSTSRPSLKGKIQPALNTPAELAEFLASPTWSVHDVVPEAQSTNIDARVVRKMLKLSGLSTDISPEEEQKWIDALNTQVGFINHLREGENGLEPTENGAEMFRLLASDYAPAEPLTLETLRAQVDAVEKDVDAEKGELGFDFAQFVRSRVTLEKP